MAGLAASRAFRRLSHSSTGEVIARIAGRPRILLLVAIGLGLANGGCSFSHQLGSMFEKGKGEPVGEAGGTVGEAQRRAREPSDADLDLARAAATELLSRGKDMSLPWENPRTGARGTVTPIAAAYDQDGVLCRDFLASYVRGGDEKWLQGEACRTHRDRWEVRSLKPRARS